MPISSKELVERLRSQLPVAMELPDPITGAPFQVHRDNMLALLAIDVDNLVLESQTVAMLYGEMARVHVACKLAREQAEVEFRKWKAGKAAWARKNLDGGMTAGKNPVKKPPTKDQIEEHYRNDPDYEREYQKTHRWNAIVDLMADLKHAFDLKQRALHDLHGVTFGHDRVASSDDRMREMEAAQEAYAIPMMTQSGFELEEIRRAAGQPAAVEAPAAEVPSELPPPPATSAKSAKSTKTAKRPARRPAKKKGTSK